MSCTAFFGGVFADYVLTVMWSLLLANVYRIGSFRGEEDLVCKGVHHMRAALFEFYSNEKAKGDRPVYEVKDFRRTSIGTKASPSLRAKGAETGTLLFFAKSLMDKFAHLVTNGGILREAGGALVQYMEITRRYDWRIPTRARSELVNSYLRYCRLREPSGLPSKPKLHQYSHLVFIAYRFGNPRCLAAWVDESLNRELAAVCRTAHAKVWTRRIMATFSHGFGPILLGSSP